MLDKILTFIVVIGPTLFAIGVEAISESVRKNRFWKYGVIAFGLILSGLTWWQISRQESIASIAQESAIERVATQTSERVTKAVGEQYQAQVKNLTDQIGDLKGQLSAQGKDVSTIKESNIVTGKNPVKVEVTNQGSITALQTPIMTGLRLTSPKMVPSDDPNLPFAMQVTLQTDALIEKPAFMIECDGEIGKGGFFAGYGSYNDAREGVLKDHPNVYIFGWRSPSFEPGTPIVVTLWSKKAIKVTNFTRIPAH